MFETAKAPTVHRSSEPPRGGSQRTERQILESQDSATVGPVSAALTFIHRAPNPARAASDGTVRNALRWVAGLFARSCSPSQAL